MSACTVEENSKATPMAVDPEKIPVSMPRGMPSAKPNRRNHAADGLVERALLVFFDCAAQPTARKTVRTTSREVLLKPTS